MGGGGGAQKITCTSQGRSVKSHTAGVQGSQGPLKGPGSCRVLDCPPCYLTLILKHSDTKRDTNTKTKT